MQLVVRCLVTKSSGGIIPEDEHLTALLFARCLRRWSCAHTLSRTSHPPTTNATNELQAQLNAANVALAASATWAKGMKLVACLERNLGHRRRGCARWCSHVRSAVTIAKESRARLRHRVELQKGHLPPRGCAYTRIVHPKSAMSQCELPHVYVHRSPRAHRQERWQSWRRTL
jgi:hypothetical protein